MRFSALRRAAVLAAPVLLLSLSEVASAADAVMDDGVMVLTGETIEQAIKDHSHLVVEFYAPCKFPWSRVCRLASCYKRKDLSTIRSRSYACGCSLFFRCFVLAPPDVRHPAVIFSCFFVDEGGEIYDR